MNFRLEWTGVNEFTLDTTNERKVKLRNFIGDDCRGRVFLYEWRIQFATCCLCNGLFLRSQVELTTVATTQFRRHY